MRLSWLAFLVAVYVSLDVSNPLMPGALMFGIDDSVEARHADRFRGQDLAAPLLLAPAPERVEPIRPTIAVSLAAAREAPRLRQSRVRRVPPSRSTRGASSEDH